MLLKADSWLVQHLLNVVDSPMFDDRDPIHVIEEYTGGAGGSDQSAWTSHCGNGNRPPDAALSCGKSALHHIRLLGRRQDLGRSWESRKRSRFVSRDIYDKV